MRRRLRALVWVEAGLALASVSLCLLTLVWPDWIELVLRVDPDRHSGILEWTTALGLFALTCAFAALARTGHRRLAGDPMSTD